MNQQLSQTLETYIGFEVLTAAVMKSSVFWDINLLSRVMKQKSLILNLRAKVLKMEAAIFSET
jgi:hypothetical protein